MRTRLLTAVLLCTACSSEAAGPSRANGNPITPSDGMQNMMTPEMMEPGDFGNPDEMAQAFDAGPADNPSRPAGDCSPGLYLGTYSCDITLFGLLPVPLAGDVSFNLSINESTVDRMCDPADEFCSDLVISENGGTLFGLAFGFYGFETMLEGALDCTTGEFRASGVDGRWGTAISTDPNDPNALLTVEDPPMGTFDGSLMGMHTTDTTESISGNWDLTDSINALNCAGPFTVTLQP